MSRGSVIRTQWSGEVPVGRTRGLPVYKLPELLSVASLESCHLEEDHELGTMGVAWRTVAGMEAGGPSAKGATAWVEVPLFKGDNPP